MVKQMNLQKNLFNRLILAIKFDVTKEHIQQYNPNFSETSDPTYRTLIIVGSGSKKANSLFNLIK